MTVYNFIIDHRYFDGKIYCIYSKRLPKLLYIGSTVRALRKRFSAHKQKPINRTIAKLFAKYDDMTIELIENYPCFNKDQLCHREQYHMIRLQKEYGVILNSQSAYGAYDFAPKPLLPKPLVEWYMEQHPEYSTQVQLILLRDYDIDDSVNKLLDKLLTPRR